MTRIAAVIINYHAPALTREAVASVLASRNVEPSVVLVDNESDGAWAVDSWRDDPRVTVIANPGNIGFGAACNQGIDHALAEGAEQVLLLNNDAWIEPEALAILSPVARQYGLAAPRILMADGRIYSAGGIVELHRARARNRGIYEPDDERYALTDTFCFASACALLIDHRALNTGIRFHEPYFLYYEDADICLALTARGFKIGYEPRARVVHHESASMGVGIERARRLAYYNARNRLLLLKRHGSRWQRISGSLWLVFSLIIATLRGTPATAWQGINDGLANRFGKKVF